MKVLELPGDKTTYAIINRIIDEETNELIYEVLPIKKLDFTEEDVKVIGTTSHAAQERELDSIVLHIHEFRRIIDGTVAKTMRSYHIVPVLRSEKILSENFRREAGSLEKY